MCFISKNFKISCLRDFFENRPKRLNDLAAWIEFGMVSI